MPIYGYTDYTRPDRLGQFLNAISSSKQQYQLAGAQEERKKKEEGAAALGAGVYAKTPTFENFLSLAGQGTQASKTTSDAALAFQKEKAIERESNILPVGRGAGLYDIKNQDFLLKPDKSYPAKLAPYMLKYPDDPDSAVKEMMDDEMRLKMAGIRGKSTLNVGGKPIDMEYIYDPDTKSMKLTPIGEHFEKPSASGSAESKKKESLKRIEQLTAKNQALGEKKVALDNDIRNHVGMKMSNPLSDETTAQKANLQQQIEDNEAELEKHNKEIGGTYRAGGKKPDATPGKRIKVKLKTALGEHAQGTLGEVDESEFDPNTMDKVNE